MKRISILAAIVVALAACSDSVTEPSNSTYAVMYDEVPTGCTELEGEPVGDPGPGRTWYQGTDGRWYSCLVN